MKKTYADISDLITFKNNQGINTQGVILRITQNHIVFEVYNPYSIVQLSEVLTEVKINRSNKEIYNGKATVTNIINTGIVLIVSVSTSDSCWKDVIDIKSKDDIQGEIKSLISNFEMQQKIDVDFKLIILSIRGFLSDVKNWFDKLEHSLGEANIKIDTKFFTNNFSELFDNLMSLRVKFGELVKCLESRELGICRSFCQSQLHQFFMASPYPHRVYYKPLGFAGDYMMMHMIQRENAEGKNLYAKFINIFFTNIPIAKSVKNRTKTLIKAIEEGVKIAEKENREFNSLSIGCGPALEVKKFIESNNPKVRCNFKLLDFNEETLSFAKSESEKVISDKKIKIYTQIDSIHNLLKKTVNKEFQSERYDLIYCSGLFDYLSDRICSRLTRMFYGMLSPNGKVIVTNMHEKNYDKYMMELIFDWHLIYRDEAVMASFAPNAGKKKMFVDDTGVNLCLEVLK